MDVDTENEELADLHVDFTASEIDAAGAGDGGGNRLGCCNGCVDKVFVEGCLLGRRVSKSSLARNLEHINLPSYSVQEHG